MSRNFSIPNFFRNMPNQLLQRYFESKGYLTDFEFKGMKQTKIEPLFKAWLKLPEENRNEMNAEFTEIFELSCEKGFKAILDEAEWHFAEKALAEFVEKLSGLKGFFEKVMIVFLEHSELWKGATYFCHADRLSYWRKRKNMGSYEAAVDKVSIECLETKIAEYFHRTEGRGSHCKVEPFRRGELDYFFCYPEDYSRQSIEWEEGEFERRPHNPAFELIYIYSQTEGTLDINYRGDRKTREPLISMFNEVILKQKELPLDPDDDRVYDLSKLARKDFEFQYGEESGINEVHRVKMRLSQAVGSGHRITLETNKKKYSESILDLLDLLKQSISLKSYNITLVEISATLTLGSDDRPKKYSFTLTYPNSCSLKYDERGLILRKMLADSGIEPKAPPKNSEV